MKSTAEIFFDTLIAGASAGIQNLIGMQETEWLDFKIPAKGADEVKSAWSEAVTGFANNEGGVLVWGILANKNSDSVDCAKELHPIENPLAFKSRLSELLRGASEPPVLGVQIEIIFETEVKGYVACFVPQSTRKPHRAESVKNKPFIMRVSDNFVIPSVAMLRSLFYPGATTQLRSIWKPEWSPLPTATSENSIIQIRLSLANIGFTTAREVFLIFSSKQASLDLNWSCESTATSYGQGALLKRPLHPQAVQELGGAILNCSPVQRNRAGERTVVPAFRPFSAELQIYASDMPPVHEYIQFSEDDLEFRRELRGHMRASQNA